MEFVVRDSVPSGVGFPLDEMLVLQHLGTKVLAEVASLDRGGSGSEAVGLCVVDNCPTCGSAAVIESVGCDCPVDVIRG